MTTHGPGAAPPAFAAQINAILLDYGGTLDGDALHWLDHFRSLYAASGRPLDEATLRAAFYAADDALTADPETRGLDLDRMAARHVGLQLAHLGIDDAGVRRRLVEGFVADTRAAWHRNRPLVRRLAARYRLGVVSNFYGNMPVLLAEAELGPFATVLDSALVGLRKPDPALYQLAANRLGLVPRAVLHVGDSWERDVAPARAIGMHAAWLAPGHATMPTSPDSVWRLRSLLDLDSLLS